MVRFLVCLQVVRPSLVNFTVLSIKPRTCCMDESKRKQIADVFAALPDPNGTIPTMGDDPTLWSHIKTELRIGDAVSGSVICRRPFGVFVDIGYGSTAPALLLVPEFADARLRRLEFDDYPQIGQKINARVIHVDWDRHRIALTQNQTYDP